MAEERADERVDERARGVCRVGVGRRKILKKKKNEAR